MRSTRYVMASYETDGTKREVQLVRLPVDHEWSLIDLVADTVGPDADPRIIEEHISVDEAGGVTDDYIRECQELGHPAVRRPHEW